MKRVQLFRTSNCNPSTLSWSDYKSISRYIQWMEVRTAPPPPSWLTSASFYRHRLRVSLQLVIRGAGVIGWDGGEYDRYGPVTIRPVYGFEHEAGRGVRGHGGRYRHLYVIWAAQGGTSSRVYPDVSCDDTPSAPPPSPQRYLAARMTLITK